MTLSYPLVALDRRTWAIDLSVAVAAGLLWALALAAAPALGPWAYFAPAILGILMAAIGAAALAIFGGPRAIVAMIAFAVLVPNLSFRDRALGETGLDWQNGIKLAAWSVMLMMAVRTRHLIWKALRDPGIALAALFGCLSFASALWSPVPGYTVACAVGNLAWLSLAVIAAASLPTAAFCRALLWALLVEIVLALAASVFAPDFAWMPPSYMETDFRLRGLSGHPNLLAQHAALLMLALLSVQDSKPLGRVSMVSVLLLASLALILSGSRVTILAIGLAWLLTEIRSHRAAPHLLVGLAGVVIVGVQILIAAPDLGSILGALSRTGSASEITTLTGRTDLWQIAWEHFLERPLFGWGFNGTEQLMADSVGRSFEGNAVNAHNAVLQSLMSLGLVGSIPVLGLFLMLIYRCIRFPDRIRDRLLIYLVVLGFGEAEPLSVPMVLSFLLFWCLARDGVKERPAAAIPGSIPTGIGAMVSP
ncbi:O-antigen ligase [Beijerinckia sp. L45]|uniref:O-antigen ligase family protein n=1 Tax=Beijerinckia sp. L45 TaxID=1641855 RepID=UPI00131B1746|nr:O-antigen ligase family protein [Beijerinckia sp. L45]